MSQIPAEIAALLNSAPRAAELPDSLGAERLPVGKVVQAEVLRLLGEDLFSIAIRGTTLTASSKVPLQEGDRLQVEVTRDSAGQASLKVLGQASSDPNRVSNQTSATLSSPNANAEQAETSARAPVGDAKAILELVRPGGAIERLVEQRPDLAPRIEALVRNFLHRPAGLGAGVEELRQQVEALLPRLASTATSSSAPLARLGISEQPQKLLDQLVSGEALVDPKRFAETLATRFAGMARGLEGTLARVLSTTAAPTGTFPGSTTSSVSATSATTPLPVGSPLPTGTIVASGATVPVEAATTKMLLDAVSSLGDAETQSEIPTGTVNSASSKSLEEAGWGATRDPKVPVGIEEKGVDLRSSVGRTTESNPRGEEAKLADGAMSKESVDGIIARGAAPAVVRGVFEGDLKSQLLDLRSQLQALPQQSAESAPALTTALARTDMLLDQITAQQLRNIDGLNQYAHVEIPIDPKTGMTEARLQVFYRERGSRPDLPSDDERFTVAIFLSMSKLGDVLATVTGVDGAVSIGFTVNSSTTHEWLERSIEELRDGLVTAGHEGAMITVRTMETKASTNSSNLGADEVWEEFLDQAPSGTVAGSRLDREA